MFESFRSTQQNISQKYSSAGCALYSSLAKAPSKGITIDTSGVIQDIGTCQQNDETAAIVNNAKNTVYSNPCYDTYLW